MNCKNYLKAALYRGHVKELALLVDSCVAKDLPALLRKVLVDVEVRLLRVLLAPAASEVDLDADRLHDRGELLCRQRGSQRHLRISASIFQQSYSGLVLAPTAL